MTLLLTILGAVFGALALELPGLVLGGGLGYLLAVVVDLQKRLERLEQRGQERQPSLAPPFAPPVARTSPPVEAGTVIRPVATSLSERPEEPRGEEFVWIEEPSLSPSLRLRQRLRDFLTSGNLPVKVGVILLFFGVAFLLKYAAQQGRLPLELRLAAVALGGVALLAVGWRLRERSTPFALALQGGGVGVLYLTVFAALRLYGVLSPGAALVWLTLLAGAAAFLAVRQDAQALAVLACAGGFLAPLLASTGQGSHVQLFAYYALLNGGLLTVAWFKPWRVLNLSGYAFTFVIGGAWGWRYYRPPYFATVEPFLILFFLSYVAVAVFFARRHDGRAPLDPALVFGTPLAAFALQGGMLHRSAYGMAASALALGLFYLALGRLPALRKASRLRPLSEAFFALGVVFATLAIPFAFDDRVTAAVWALEGGAAVWIGARQKRLAPRLFGSLLQFLAGGLFFAETAGRQPAVFLANADYFGALLLALAGLTSALALYRGRDTLRAEEGVASLLLLIWGLLWWYGGGLHEISGHLSYRTQPGSALLLAALSCGASHFAGRRLRWPHLAASALILLPVMSLCALVMAADLPHPLAGIGGIAWPAALSVHFWILRGCDDAPRPALPLLHGGALWLVALLGAWELSWQIQHYFPPAGSWPLLPWGLVPAALLTLVAGPGARLFPPLQRFRNDYLTIGSPPVAALAFAWTIHANLTAPGDPWPFAYAPLLNPLDFAIALVHGALIYYLLRLRDASLDGRLRLAPPVGPALLGGSILIWSSAVVLRTVHHWGDVPFRFAPLFSSVLVQSGLALVWTLLALCAMVAATRRGLRLLWLAGGALLALVVLKLFLIDLSGSGTLARIVSFLGVGLLLLVIGYLAPAPPRSASE